MSLTQPTLQTFWKTTRSGKGFTAARVEDIPKLIITPQRRQAPRRPPYLGRPVFWWRSWGALSQAGPPYSTVHARSAGWSGQGKALGE
jgi:hypothetical protein